MARLEEKVARLRERAAVQAARAHDEAPGASAAARHQRSEALREAHLSRIKAKAGDEARKVRGQAAFMDAVPLVGVVVVPARLSLLSALGQRYRPVCRTRGDFRA
jgi:hypothetical protein